jgi:hypothetical protein
MKTSVSRWVLTAAMAIGLTLRAWGQIQAGQIQAASVEGQVLKLVNSGPAVPVKDGDQLTESDTITTGANSGVVLVFMNGSSVKLGADSRLAIDEFKMDPLAEDVKMADFKDRKKDEPSVSKTNLNLVYGDMVGDVRRLNKSSSYSIKTPAGAAGIRGTIYRIVFRPDANGRAFFTVSTAEGLVVMQGVTAVEIPIPVGKEVVVTVDIPDASPGAVAKAPSAPVIVTQDIPAATSAIIVTATTTIAVAVEQAVFTPNPKAADDQAADAKQASDDKAAAEKKAADDKAAADKAAAVPEVVPPVAPPGPKPTPPPVFVPVPTALTPGAGG